MKHLLRSIFLSRTLIQLKRLIIFIIYNVSFYNNFLNSFSISCLFFGEITISSTFLEIKSSTDFGSTVFSCFMDSFFGSSFHSIQPCFCSPDRFRVNNKYPNPLTFFFSWFYRKTCHVYLLISNVEVTLSSNSNGLPF